MIGIVLTLLSYIVPPPTNLAPYILSVIRPLATINAIVPVLEIMTIMKWATLLVTGYIGMRFTLWLAGFINPQFNNFGTYKGSLIGMDMKQHAIMRNIQGR